MTSFVYELGASDTATLRVTVEGTAWDAERVRARLDRGVDVLEVSIDGIPSGIHAGAPPAAPPA